MNTNTTATETVKTRAIICKRDGDNRIEYWVLEPDGSVTTCAPNVWLKLNLTDATTPREMERCAEIRAREFLKKRPFGVRVDLNRWERETNPPPAMRYQAICNHLKLSF